MAGEAAGPRRSLDETIRDLRIYCEVERETERRAGQRITLALRVWLWAILPKGAGALPGGPGCLEAAAALRRVAAAAIEGADLDPAPDVDPVSWRLYASRQLPGADELRLAVNLRAPPEAAGPEQAAREQALARLRGALRELGVFEGRWRQAEDR